MSSAETRFIHNRFVELAGEVLVNKHPIAWIDIDGLEVVKAPRVGGIAGLVVRHFVHGSQRYHIGIYFGGGEVVLPNVTFNTAKYIVQSIAFYAPGPIAYTGLDGLSPVIDG